MNSLPTDLNSSWKTMMERFSKDEPSLWSMLTQGRIQSPEKDLIRWQPNKKEGSEFYLITLNRDDKKSKIVQSLKEITGKEYRFEALAPTGNTGSGNNSDEAYIGRLYETFGKEPVDIVEEI